MSVWKRVRLSDVSRAYAVALLVLSITFAVLVAWSPETSYARPSFEQGQLALLPVVYLMAGLFACATIEVAKRLFSARGVFFRESIRIWLGDAAFDEVAAQLRMGSVRRGPSSMHAAAADFDVPLEQLMARVAVVLERAVDRPLAYRGLSKRLLFAVDDVRDQRFDALREALQVRDNLRLTDSDVDPRRARSQADDAVVVLWPEVEREVALHAQEELNGFQLAVARRWRMSVTLWSLALAGVASLLIALFIAPGVVLVAGLTAPFVGGFLSWVLRDVSAGVERWRDRA
ncbi:hypothetical protein [Streptomyces sp. AC495_CC817]|uniref:hypothetical protein n=1 Tax=Streptomyces sp. AC495_CC817 TaxID=2823900 RepID=UPI001C251671|nr:hypothetical protein [Streptomyces sp. AC495_CC817]